MLVMQASDKPSPKQLLGQRREFIPCRRSAETSAGDGHDVGLSDACIIALVVPYVAPAGVREALMDGIAAEWARQCSNLWRFSSRGVIGCPHSHAVSPVPISYAMYLARLVGDNDRCGGA